MAEASLPSLLPLGKNHHLLFSCNWSSINIQLYSFTTNHSTSKTRVRSYARHQLLSFQWILIYIVSHSRPPCEDAQREWGGGGGFRWRHLLERQTVAMLPRLHLDFHWKIRHTSCFLALQALVLAQGFDYSYLLIYLSPREMKCLDRGSEADFRSKTKLIEIKYHRRGGAAAGGEGGWGGGRGKLEPLILSPKKILSWWLAMLSSSLERLASVWARVQDEPAICSLGRRSWGGRGPVDCSSVRPHRERQSSMLVARAGDPAAAHKFRVPLTCQSPPNNWTKSTAHKFSSSPSLQWDGLSPAHSGHLGGSQATRVLHRPPLGLLQVASPSSGPSGEVLCTGIHGE